MTGRPTMLRAADCPWLLDAVTAARNAGASFSEAVNPVIRQLIALRGDDREKVLRAVLDLFGVAAELRPRVMLTFGIFPARQKSPRRRSPNPKRARIRDLGPRRPCSYGAGAYVRDRSQEPASGTSGQGAV